MSVEIDHAETWVITIEHEEGDDWPDCEQVRGTRSRFMRPYKVVAQLRRGQGSVSVVIFGDPLSQSALAPPRVTSRYVLAQAPEWVQVLVTKTRELHGLGPGNTGVAW